jgi:hypothetical protein
MIVKRAFVPLILIAVLFCSCTKEKSSSSSPISEGDDTSSHPVSSGSLPEVVSASLSPELPLPNLPILVRCDGLGGENEPVDYVYRWFVDDAVVQEGPIPILNPGTYKKGSSVFVEIIPSNPSAKGKSFRTEVKNVGNLPPTIESIKLNPSKPAVGDIITAIPTGIDPDGDIVSYKYEWTVNSIAIPDLPREKNTFDTTGLKKGDLLCAVVMPSDGEMHGAPTLSEFVTLENATPKITSYPPSTLVKGIYEYQVFAKDPDGDQLFYSLIKFPAGMTIDSSTGLIRWEPPSSLIGKREIAVQISVTDGNGGAANQEYTLYLNIR